jgi:hypothetical protein
MPYRDPETRKQKAREYSESWREKHPGAGALAALRWYHRNRDKAAESTAVRRKTEAFRAQSRQKYWSSIENSRKKAREWARSHPEAFAKRRAEHPEETRMRAIVGAMLRRSSLTREQRSWRYLGCTPGFFRNHLESLFQPGMTWANYGQWHVDHIVPLSWFPFDRDPSLLFVASHWTNLQPLWAVDNFRKGNRSMGESKGAAQ